LSNPLVHFFFLKPQSQKEKVRKKKNAVWGVSLTAVSDKACAALTRTHWRGGSYGCGANTPLFPNKKTDVLTTSVFGPFLTKPC
ncbi:MAG: hypothetical protein IJW79_12000, partial [Clostridia bacterium]|nr:hypothetical protein [Clostridia bacterium]